MIILVGLPGVGKTTEAQMLADEDKDRIIHSLDIIRASRDGPFTFDPNDKEILMEHFRNIILTLQQGNPVVIDNCNISQTMRNTLKQFADIYGYEVVIRLIDSGLSDEQLAKRNVHNVTSEKIAEMRAKLEAQTF